MAEQKSAILCPVDLSESSAGALRYAHAIAEHFGARLVVLLVEEPLLTEALDLGSGTVWDEADARGEVARFAADILQNGRSEHVQIDYRVAVGKPAAEILKVAREAGVELIVISTHGLTGMRKLFFGSTTERVLREAPVPVLATPPGERGPADLEGIRSAIGRILVPVDLTGASAQHVQVAGAVASAMGVPFIATHVVEPLRSPMAAHRHLPSLEHERRSRAEDALRELLAESPHAIAPEALVAYGEPAEEIAKVAHDRKAGLIVMGLRASAGLAPHIGSVTYRVLCLARTLVLALPSSAAAAEPQAPAARSFVHK